ncbi:unnamed protein product [Ranitomeya imitator]|uniref:AAA ATPase AAA+ lid domain-containing protein n=1 Tax=Ranitomeya imitator TaxID=111125 RepID=A0ABN9LJK2_9NEOB|nr:unnamed protein product [Ranitomeya imitator]
MCEGYCGADIKALCTEAALIALRRRYPQIYASSQKLQLDVSSVVLGAHDFYHAMTNIVPASQRAVMSPGHALTLVIRPLLQRTFTDLIHALHKVFPHAEFSRDHKKDDDPSLLLDDSEDESSLSIFDVSSVSGSPKKQPAAPHKPFLHFTTSACHQPTSYRPRFLLCGEPGSGQTSHLAPAVLHILEKFSVHRLDLPALYSVSAKTPEESCAQRKRKKNKHYILTFRVCPPALCFSALAVSAGQPESRADSAEESTVPEDRHGMGLRHRWSLESCLCDSSPATTQRRCSDRHRCRIAAALFQCDGNIGGLFTALQNAADKPLMPVGLPHPRFSG